MSQETVEKIRREEMKFYCVKCKKPVNVPESQVKYKIIKTRGGKRKMAMAISPKGNKVYKFVKM